MTKRKINQDLCIIVYHELEKYDLVDSHTLAKILEMNHRKARLCIADLRVLFRQGKVKKYVCINSLGYFLSDDSEDAEFSFNERLSKAYKMIADVSADKQAFINLNKEKLF